MNNMKQQSSQYTTKYIQRDIPLSGNEFYFESEWGFFVKGEFTIVQEEEPTTFNNPGCGIETEHQLHAFITFDDDDKMHTSEIPEHMKSCLESFCYDDIDEAIQERISVLKYDALEEIGSQSYDAKLMEVF